MALVPDSGDDVNNDGDDEQTGNRQILLDLKVAQPGWDPAYADIVPLGLLAWQDAPRCLVPHWEHFIFFATYG
jgi:hypothetical protein